MFREKKSKLGTLPGAQIRAFDMHPPDLPSAHKPQNSTIVHLNSSRRSTGTTERGAIRLDNQGGFTDVKMIEFLWFKGTNTFYNIPDGKNRVVMAFVSDTIPDTAVELNIVPGQYTDLQLAEQLTGQILGEIKLTHPALAAITTDFKVTIDDYTFKYIWTWTSTDTGSSFAWVTSLAPNGSDHYMQHRVGLQQSTSISPFVAYGGGVQWKSISIPTLQGIQSIFFESSALRQQGLYSQPGDKATDPDSRKSISVLEPITVIIPFNAAFGETIYFHAPSSDQYSWGFDVGQSLTGSLDYNILDVNGDPVDFQDTSWEMVLRFYH